ncbi:dihydroneopterin aldolase [Pontibacter ummariensis]|uniref:7,8-dihydroneopterin aldolase n=1 Tax=Pontibacter ummariensis TaxID=1610492 RepID=A0A239BF48_9BACT|nr:dihydroneopterin aldolase [Pontibacter ummariensis]PRY16466.1 dihydroneopterin aldolase [Pontibacter ummariensis]SNS05663.1 dihydroneopterin aldolase [Pontibacter ummariensis]
MGQIALEGLEFFAFHGYYDEEQKIGNKYGIDLFINTDLRRAAESDDLHETVNYEVLYDLVLREMKEPARLLEHLGHRIIDKVYEKFPFVQSVKVKVYKYNPPLGGICKWAKVTLEEAR